MSGRSAARMSARDRDAQQANRAKERKAPGLCPRPREGAALRARQGRALDAVYLGYIQERAIRDVSTSA